MIATTTQRRWLRTTALAGTIGLAAVACASPGSTPSDAAATAPAATPSSEAPPTDAAATSAPASDAPVREGADPSQSGTVTRQQAEEAALAAVGSGRVTWSGPEDDRGAAWEVEVTRPDGTEVDVLIAADGTAIKTVDKVGDSPPLTGGGTVPSGGVISQADAEAAALAEIGEGRVTWVGREDERGAAWEVEITRPNGREIDVLVAADGSIIR